MKRTTYASAIVSVLASGTLANILGKSLYGIKSIGIDGTLKPFSKPLASTLFMFLGMFICLPISMLYNSLASIISKQNNNQSDVDDIEEPLLLDHVESAISLQSVYQNTKQWWRQYDAVLIPTLFDLVATVLMSIGLLFITTSVYQMLRGSEILFTALLTVFFLKRKLNFENIAGLFLCFCGILIVAMASLMDTKNNQENNNNNPVFFTSSTSSSSSSTSSTTPSSAQVILGMLLIIAAEAVQSSQVIAEDYLMTVSSPSKITPIHMVGYEGAFGTFLMLCIILPIAQFTHFGEEGSGLHEDSLESWTMITHSQQLVVVIAVYIACMSVYNVAGMVLTDAAGALTRTVSETIRTLLVWGLDLLLFYYGRSKTAKIGEPWTENSWIQAIGFTVLFLGSVLYGHGDERHARELERGLQEKARQRWGIARAAVSFLTLMKAAEQQHIRVEDEEARVPIKRPRIAGPSRIRTALHQLRRRRGGGNRVDVRSFPLVDEDD